MDLLITSFKEKVKKQTRLGVFLLVITGISLFFSIKSEQIDRRDAITSNLTYICEQVVDNKNKRTNDHQLASISDFCQKVVEVKPLLEAYSSVQFQGNMSSIPEYLRMRTLLLQLLSVCLFALSIYTFWFRRDKQFIKNHFMLTDREAQLYEWVGELKKKKFVLTELEFSDWVKQSTTSYSVNELNAMKLNFLLSNNKEEAKLLVNKIRRI